MVFAFAVPAMAQEVCEPCAKCPAQAMVPPCPTGDQTGMTCSFGDEYFVGTLPHDIGTTYALCPVIFDICDCDDPSDFTSGTTVGIRLTLLVNGLEGDHGAYFSEAYTGNVIMGDSKTWLCDPAPCATETVVPGGISWCDPLNVGVIDPGELGTLYKDDNFIATVPLYYSHNGTNYVLEPLGPSGVCPPARNVVRTMSAPTEGLVIDLEDETYNMSHWALDIPGVILTTDITDCSTISVEICMMTEAGGGICGECSCVCSCVYDLYRACCVAGAGCIRFPYVVSTATGWDTGIALMNAAPTALPLAADMTATFTYVQDNGAVSTWTDANWDSNRGLKAYAFSTGILPNLVPAPTSTIGWLRVDTNFDVDGMLYLTNGVFGAAHLGACCTGICH